MSLPDKVRELMGKGVIITNPFSVEIGDEVPLERISGQGVVFYGGTKIYGAKTLISAGVKLGYEGPTTVVDCRLGPQVELNGGFFQSSVFLDKAGMASGAHVREGSLLEDEAKAGHAVGLKQTILFPFVTLGSLINFCDCLMAGGTGRSNHSEVGSSYIHFNYTPQQDKATASLIGDVPRGVMLDKPPIFLGGQGGLVGPVRIDYGTVITAGTVWRRDSQGAKLLHGGERRPLSQDYDAASYKDIRRKVFNNIVYIANILALKQWYRHVRRPFFNNQELGDGLYEGAIEVLERALDERIKRLREFADKAGNAGAGEIEGATADFLSRQRELKEKWPEIEACFRDQPEERYGEKERDHFLGILQKNMETRQGYVDSIRSLDTDARHAGTSWLQKIIDEIVWEALNYLPSFRSYIT